LQIKDSNDTVVGQSFQEDPINNANNQSQTSGAPIMLYYVEKPKPDDYSFVVSSLSDGTKKLKIYLYDKLGNAFVYDSYVDLKNNQPKIITTDFEYTDNIYIAKATYDSLRSDLNKALRKKEIKPAFYASLIARSAMAQAQQKLGRKDDELETLMKMQESLDSSLGSKVFDLSYTYILYDLNYLESNL
jgi:hypothetical protein